jgi:hypothetical protein
MKRILTVLCVIFSANFIGCMESPSEKEINIEPSKSGILVNAALGWTRKGKKTRAKLAAFALESNRPTKFGIMAANTNNKEKKEQYNEEAALAHPSYASTVKYNSARESFDKRLEKAFSAYTSYGFHKQDPSPTAIAESGKAEKEYKKHKAKAKQLFDELGIAACALWKANKSQVGEEVIFTTYYKTVKEAFIKFAEDTIGRGDLDFDGEYKIFKEYAESKEEKAIDDYLLNKIFK